MPAVPSGGEAVAGAIVAGAAVIVRTVEKFTDSKTARAIERLAVAVDKQGDALRAHTDGERNASGQIATKLDGILTNVAKVASNTERLLGRGDSKKGS